jgi:uncharacterized protein YabN with tetrapyrrole methylase and pyrophosphatase domain
VPHTVEEAYELADAAIVRDDTKLIEELGDVLFQVYFLSLLLEERGAGDLATVAERHMAKLIRRHPHVFGDVEAADADAVRRRWDEIKLAEAAERTDQDAAEGRGRSLFGELPETLPATLYARKVQARGARTGLADDRHAGESLSEARSLCEQFFSPGPASEEECFDYVGELLFSVVDAARALDVDPELALRRAADRYRAEVEVSAGAKPSK